MGTRTKQSRMMYICALISFYLHETLILRLSSMAPFRNHGFIALQVSSLPSYSGRTLKDNVLAVIFDEVDISVFVVISACLIVSPSRNHWILAAGWDPHVSHFTNATRPVDKISLGVTISTFKGFTIVLNGYNIHTKTRNVKLSQQYKNKKKKKTYTKGMNEKDKKKFR